MNTHVVRILAYTAIYVVFVGMAIYFIYTGDAQAPSVVKAP